MAKYISQKCSASHFLFKALIRTTRWWLLREELLVLFLFRILKTKLFSQWAENEAAAFLTKIFAGENLGGCTSILP